MFRDGGVDCSSPPVTESRLRSWRRKAPFRRSAQDSPSSVLGEIGGPRLAATSGRSGSPRNRPV